MFTFEDIWRRLGGDFTDVTDELKAVTYPQICQDPNLGGLAVLFGYACMPMADLKQMLWDIYDEGGPPTSVAAFRIGMLTFFTAPNAFFRREPWLFVISGKMTFGEEELTRWHKAWIARMPPEKVEQQLAAVWSDAK